HVGLRTQPSIMTPTLDELLQASVQRHAGRPALAWEARQMTYRDLGAAAERLAARLPDDLAGQRVGILAPNTPAFVVALLAAWRRGAVAVPLSARWREYELRRVLPDAEPAALIAIETHRGFSFADLLAAIIPELPTLSRCLLVDPLGEVIGERPGPAQAIPAPLDPEIALLLYTSGTTGAPKGALVRHRTYLDGVPAINAILAATPDDVCLMIIPVAHAFGLEMLVAALAAGSQSVLIDSTFSMGPLLEAMRRYRATLLHGSPALFIAFLKQAAGDRGLLRTGFVAGASCPSEVLARLDAAGLCILNLYGMTEIAAATCCRPDDPAEVRYTTVGRPLPGYTFRVVGGEVGEVQVQGPHVTPGYYRQPEQTAAAHDEGWFRTGDLGSLDDRGNLRIVGRAKEVIHVAGLNVFPAEVEGLLLTHPDVVQAAVVGVPHPTLGEVPQAFVVLRPGTNLAPTALLQFARERIAGYKLPYVIRLLPALPLLASGKPDRIALARIAREEAHAGSSDRVHPAL
ncbi:MAG TPA: class I adenylate-forming enzyme family protein, partial [Gemmataceae bacterium]|nr:class I adenylate-forming enzyme family protein [Gemmataceae bacterium]